MIGRNAAVVEHDRRGVGCANPELVLDSNDLHARGSVLDDERLDPGATGGLVDGRPDHDEAL